ncbi:hypothetical protein CEV31_3623 [Brucella thiophenivorans]|uniref:Uncharacterized protein n=1 Tax=Brucella thiophenivorans TaxID=571255 RepID=A0A256FBK8_9HYPH|nr:hypothetical protein CEV31_3623 [Brucella thiophenivorans]
MAETEKSRLTYNGQLMLAVDHFFRPASATFALKHGYDCAPVD